MALPRWLGSFSRSRADMAASVSMLGSVNAAWVPGSHQVVALNNNYNTGAPLALLDMLVLVTAAPQIATAYLLPGPIALAPPQPVAMWPGRPAVAGTLGAGADVRDATAPVLFTFVADGKNWLNRGGAPLAIIPAGYAFEIGFEPANVAGLEQPLHAQIFASFIWSYWNFR